MESGLELTTYPDMAIASPSDRRSEVICGVGLLASIAVLFAVALLPLSSLLWLTGFGATFAGLAALPWPSKQPLSIVFPDDIFDPVLREAYREIQCARGQLVRALAEAPALASVAPSMNARCNEAVRSCARLALTGNRVHDYLSSNSRGRITEVAVQLRAKASAAHDESTARDLEKAAAAYDRQLAIYDQLAQKRERIRARLDLVLASLHSFIAAVVRHQSAEDEQLAIAGESLSEQVDDLRDELEAIESALELDLAA